MKRLLVPTDFSPTAERAFRLACDLAAKMEAAVILYHLHSPQKNEFLLTTAERDLFTHQVEINLLKRMQRLVKKVTGDIAHVPVSTILGREPVADNVLGFAEHNDIDMIIMGTQGASGLRRTIVGSVASHIAGKAKIPVLLVPRKYNIQDIQKVIFASNYAAADQQALELAVDISRRYHAGVTVLHLLNAYLSENEKASERMNFETYAFAMQRAFNSHRLKFELVPTSSVTETMENLDKTMPYDLMVMVRRNKGFYEKYFIGSFTKNMAYVTNRLLLIIPAEYAYNSEKLFKNTPQKKVPALGNLEIEKRLHGRHHG